MSETKKKTFAVLTSGGDAPGMNAAVRSVVSIFRRPLLVSYNPFCTSTEYIIVLCLE